MSIQKIEAQSPEAQSADLLADNVAKLRALFPELVTETLKGGKPETVINVDVLKALVGDATATDADEKYGLNWHGKRRARQLALTPSTGTLRPCPQESVDWDSTQNLMIEGDNLEVLKLLQKSYAGKVKLIYIDPPYNTGKDFVYPDNFQDNIKNYLELTGQMEGGAKIGSNTEASGRFHTDWLNMMYPRLKLARNLLRDDGVMFISIDDHEQHNLRTVLDDVFGEENFASTFIVKSNPRGSQSTSMSAGVHEYIACITKSSDSLISLSVPLDERMTSEYDKKDEFGKFRLLGLRQRGGFWRKTDRPLLHYPIYISEEDGSISIERKSNHLIEVLPIQPTTGEPGTWRWGKEKVKIDGCNLIAKTVSRDGAIVWDIFQKDYLDGLDGKQKETKPKTIWDEKELNYQNGTSEVKGLFDQQEVFDFPKPLSLLNRVVTIGSAINNQDIVLDFFAGSGTTGHSTMAMNAADSGNRRFILVQLPEPLKNSVIEKKLASNFCDQLGKPRTIAELTKERLRRAGAKVKADNPMFSGDTGFRVFKLDTSNIRAWQPSGNLAQDLVDHMSHLNEGRSNEDVLYELLLKLGLDLCVPMAERCIAGKTVHSIGGGVLMACLDDSITAQDAEALALGMAAWRTEQQTAGDTTAVFRDSAFENDVAKSNLAAILAQHGVAQVRSL